MYLMLPLPSGSLVELKFTTAPSLADIELLRQLLDLAMVGIVGHKKAEMAAEQRRED